MKQSDIKERRKQAGLSQGELADHLSTSPKTVYNWEAGTVEMNTAKLKQVQTFFDSLDVKTLPPNTDLIEILYRIKAGEKIDITLHLDALIERVRLYEVVRKENEELRRELRK